MNPCFKRSSRTETNGTLKPRLPYCRFHTPISKSCLELFCYKKRPFPGLCLLRLWRWKFGAILLGSLLPVGFALALVVAGIEERLFVIKYRDNGIGPTPRWMVGTHWLAYDRDTRRLYGSD